jgi:hypothetical protein
MLENSNVVIRLFQGRMHFNPSLLSTSSFFLGGGGGRIVGGGHEVQIQYMGE